MLRSNIHTLFLSPATWLFTMSLAIAFSAYGQVAGGTLSGTVTDSSNAAIARANVSVTNSATGITRVVASDAAGLYSVPNLLPGTYNVEVSASGFSTQARTGVTVAVGTGQVLNVSLKIGAVAERIEVAGDVQTIDLATSTISSVVDATTMRELPLNGRDWTSLATLQPGVIAVRTQAPSNVAANRGNRGFGNALTDDGHRPTDNNYRMNGISINDYSNSAPGSALGVDLGVDAIQEFSVATTNYSAEYGRSAGAVLNAITKSGTNGFHGDGFWFRRDAALDARNYFDPAVIPPFRRNQFGAAVGGPIRKDKTFFFADYEGIRQTQSVTFQDSVPSADARKGILHNADGTTTTIVPDAKVVPFLGLWPLPNAGLIGTGNTGVFKTAGESIANENYVTARIDHKVSDRDSLAGTFFFDNTPLTSPDALVDVLNQIFTRRHLYSLEETHIFSNALVNSLRLGVSRTTGKVNAPVKSLNPLAQDPSLAAIPNFFAPIINVPGLTTEQGGFGAQSFYTHNWNSGQVYDDAFLVKGNHSLRFGFAFERMQYNLSGRTFENGTFTFPSLQGFLSNQPTTVSLLNPAFTKEEAVRQSLFGGYLQDDWRLRPTLTVNIGLRYEMLTLPTDANNQFAVVQNIFTGTAVPVTHLWQRNQTTKDFEPRVGVSWDPFRDHRTAVKAGFGIYDTLPLPYEHTVTNVATYPYSLISSASLTTHPGSFPSGALAFATFDPTKLSVRFVDQNPSRSYAMNWNLNIQRDLGWNTFATVGYSGSRSIHQPLATVESNSVPGTLTAAGYLWPLPVGSGTRLNPNVGSIHALFWDGFASYHGLQAQIKKNMGHGVQAQASYSWSHCIDSGSSPGLGDAYLNSVPSLLFYDKQHRDGNCDFDLRQAFTANYVWMLPRPSFGGPAAGILGGWELGGIIQASTGDPFTVSIGGDPLGQLAGASAYPDRLHIPGCDSVVNPGNVKGYLKLNCFSPPIAPASFASQCKPAAASVASVTPNTCMNLMGNAGRNQIFGPGLVNVDFSLFKNTPIRKISETFNVQLRVEAFNLLNHANFQSPLDNKTLFNQDGTSVPGAGALDATTTTSRQIQLGIKAIW